MIAALAAASAAAAVWLSWPGPRDACLGRGETPRWNPAAGARCASAVTVPGGRRPEAGRRAHWPEVAACAHWPEVAARARLVVWTLTSTRRVRALLVAVGAVCALLAGGPVASVLTAVWGPTVLRGLSGWAGPAGAGEHRAADAEFVRALAAGLRAGLDPLAALAAADPGAAGEPWTDITSVPDQLRRMAWEAPSGSRASGARRPLERLAACWEVSVRQGGGLATAVEQVAAAEAEELQQEQDTTASLAGARTSAILLGGLPLVGAALSGVSGVDTVHFFLETFPGGVCAILGSCLDLAGIAWIRRISAQALGEGSGPGAADVLVPPGAERPVQGRSGKPRPDACRADDPALSAPGAGADPREATRQRRLALAAAGAAAGAAALLIPGWFGVLAAGPAGIAVWRRVVSLEPASIARRRRLLLAQLPEALDLLGACLAGGAPPAAAVKAVAGVTAQPLRDVLDRVGLAYSRGAAPGEAWAACTAPGAPGALRQTGRIVVRAEVSGTTAALDLGALAAAARAESRAQARAGTRRAEVAIVLPLGLCLLPAFMFLGVAPLVAGLLASVGHL